MSAVSLGLGARGLKDKDVFSKSDPFCVISRPSLTGGFNIIRVSETRKNTLNPDWSDFLFKSEEVSGNDMTLKLKIQIFDDDGKKGMDKKDDLLGEGSFSLKELEAAQLVQTGLKLFDGKRQKPCGTLVVRSFKLVEGQKTGETASSYPNSSKVARDGAGGYPPGSGYPGTGYPPGQTGGYPSAPGSGYPPQNPGYPPSVPYPAQPGFPTGHPGYPPAQPSYPPGQPGYPPGQPGYPPSQPGYPPGQPGYPPGQPGYPPVQPSYPPGQPGYPPGQPGAGFVMPGGPSLYPDSNLPQGPGYRQ